VNVGLADVPTIMALIVQHAASPNDLGLQQRNLTLLAHYVRQIALMRGGFAQPKDFVQAVEDPMAQLGVAATMDKVAGGEADDQLTGLPPVIGVKLNDKITDAIVGSEPRRIWKITGSATVGKVSKRIVAIWDQTLVSMQAGGQQDGPGGFVYWREE